MLKQGLLIISFVLATLNLVFSQDYTVPGVGSITITGCSGNISDPGGSDNYQNDLDGTMLIYPSVEGQYASLSFTSFDTEQSFDFLYIYDGTTTSAPLIDKHSGNDLPDNITASNPSGALLLRFTSDYNSNREGFSANLSCSSVKGEYLSIPVSYYSYTYTASSFFNLSIESNVDWTISDLPSWIQLSSIAGTGSASVNISVSDNNSFDSRIVTLTVSGGNFIKTVQIYQSGYYDLYLSSSNISLNSDSVLTAVSVEADGYFWNITSLPDWLSVSTTTGTGTMDLQITAQENSGSNRSGFMQFSYGGGYIKTMTIFQLGSLSNNQYMAGDGADQTITGCSGFIISPGGIDGYSDDLNSMVTIKSSDEGKIIKLDFKYFFTEQGSDILSVYNGNMINADSLIKNYSGNLSPFGLTSKGSALTLKFISDNAYTYTGFIAQISCVLPPVFLPDTGVQTITSCNTTIASRKDQNGNYNNNVNGTFVILPDQPGKELVLSFTSFELESGFDYLSIYNGISTDNSDLINYFTGSSIPGNITATGSSGALTLNFQTDYSGVYSGFLAQVSCALNTSPNNNLSISPSTLYVPVSGGVYNLTITSDIDWTISTNEGITLATTSGYGNSFVDISVAQNAGDFDRSIILTITGGDIKKTVTIVQAATVTSTVNLSNGLVAYYPFNGNANDESGNGNNLYLTGTITLTSPGLTTDKNGNQNSCYQFGPDMQVFSTTIPALGSLSVSMLFYVPETTYGSYYPTLFDFYNDSQLNSIEDGMVGQHSIKNYLSASESSSSASVSINANQGTIQTNVFAPDGSLSNNQWYHVVTTYDLSEKRVKIYINGTLMANEVASYDHTSLSRLNIGSAHPLIYNTSADYNTTRLANYFTGKLDDIKIYNRALSEAEVGVLYTEGCDSYFFRSPMITLTGNTLAVTPVAGAAYQWYYNNISVTGATDAVYTGTMDAGDYKVSISKGTCSVTTNVYTIAGSVNLENGLVAYYPFNGNANDESGNGNNGSVIGANLIADRFGNTNSAYYFDGVSSYIRVKANSTLDLTTSAGFSFWLKWTDVIKSNTEYGSKIISKGLSGQADGYAIDILNGSHPFYGTRLGELRFVGGSAGFEYITDQNEVKSAEWQHIFVNYTGSLVEIYSNGQLINQYTTSFTKIDTSSVDLTIGSDYVNQFNYTGIIDDISIYNRALNSTEIQALYNEASTITGILDSQSANESMLVYPNPSAGSFTIETLLKAPDISIINSQGIKIKSIQLPGGQHKITVDGIPAGLYVVSINSGDQRSYTKVIVE